jgi:integrase/recombinase XerD
MDTATRIAELERELAELRTTAPALAPAPKRELGRQRKSKPVETLTREEIAAIVAETPNSAEGARFRAIVALLHASGLRIGEAISLREDSLEYMGSVVVVHVPCEDGCKTGARDVPVALERIEPAMSEYMAVRDASEYLFSTWNGTAMHRNSFGRALTNYARKAGIAKRVHPHMFRHTFATEWIADGLDPASLQKMLGHKDATMTMRYAHANIDRLKEIVAAR